MSIVMLSLVAGCIQRPFPEDNLPEWEERPVVGTFQANYDEVWDAALQVLGDRAPLDVIEKPNGRLTTGWVSDFSDYIFKSYGGTHIPEPIRWRLDAKVAKATGNTTEITLTAHEQVEKDMISANLEFTGSIYGWIDVPSSTARERDLLEAMLASLEGRTKNPADIDYSGEYSNDYAQ